ncbi:hypothetical protein TVAG_015980 [Trichomonas vaginalis G3]|uniref:Uncharacterized protein n=1 Tax=Trichomonas vaginalis (strain ATCC PRA-98 / G3) TaxID=412133 RepID=A2DP68_TRIV3|nr:hypothetical protein TVAGG3_0910750 [Trichomonas vaginalis G3]EAY17768.1 hypothetical protein TVAG_015980 [Trichomonas vaginalis G3]KAI5484412.1 hypothetical protein TVAGG3_0910750 [Trichomonas vaginalis G3]|eukprot:XP_001329903.1 hypothetical protein [Trichomonas vaginalis G3]
MSEDNLSKRVSLLERVVEKLIEKNNEIATLKDEIKELKNRLLPYEMNTMTETQKRAEQIENDKYKQAIKQKTSKETKTSSKSSQNTATPVPEKPSEQEIAVIETRSIKEHVEKPVESVKAEPVKPAPIKEEAPVKKSTTTHKEQKPVPKVISDSDDDVDLIEERKPSPRLTPPPPPPPPAQTNQQKVKQMTVLSDSDDDIQF